VLVLINSEKFAHLRFCFVIGIEVHLSLFLKLLPGFVFIFLPVGFLLVTEKGRFSFFISLFFLCLWHLKLQFSFLLDGSLLLK
jgi:hypothetical protein